MSSITRKIEDDMKERAEILKQLELLDEVFESAMTDHPKPDSIENINAEYKKRRAELNERLKELDYLDGKEATNCTNKHESNQEEKMKGSQQLTVHSPQQEDSSPLELLEPNQENILRLILEKGISDCRLEKNGNHIVIFRSMLMTMSDMAFISLQSVCETLEVAHAFEHLDIKGMRCEPGENLIGEQYALIDKLRILDEEFIEKQEDFQERREEIIKRLLAIREKQESDGAV